MKVGKKGVKVELHDTECYQVFEVPAGESGTEVSEALEERAKKKKKKKRVPHPLEAPQKFLSFTNEKF